MGEAALIEAGYYTWEGDTTHRSATQDWTGKWTGKDEVYSAEDFIKNHQAQENAIRAYHEASWTHIQKLGLDTKYLGKTVNGILITESGLLAGYHLKGGGGLKEFLQKGGDVVDANGTHIF